MDKEEFEVSPEALPGMDGEQLGGVEPHAFHDDWRPVLHNLAHNLLAKGHDIIWEGRDKKGERVEIHFPVVEDYTDTDAEKAHITKKVIISVSAAAAMAGLGFTLRNWGRFSPKAKK